MRRPKLQQTAEIVARIQPLARGDRHAHGIGDAAHALEIERIDRLLEEQDVELLEAPAERHDRIGSQFAAHVEHEVDRSPDRLAHCTYPCYGQLDGRAVDRPLRDMTDHPVRVGRDRLGERIELERGVAVPQHTLGGARELIRCIGIPKHRVNCVLCRCQFRSHAVTCIEDEPNSCRCVLGGEMRNDLRHTVLEDAEMLLCQAGNPPAVAFSHGYGNQYQIRVHQKPGRGSQCGPRDRPLLAILLGILSR